MKASDTDSTDMRKELTELDLVVVGCPSLVGQSNECIQVLLV